MRFSLSQARTVSGVFRTSDVEELFAERGLAADHTTIWRWVQRYGPELEQRLASASQADQQILAR